jgi:glycerol-3-phosphate dehydrogenase
MSWSRLFSVRLGAIGGTLVVGERLYTYVSTVAFGQSSLIWPSPATQEEVSSDGRSGEILPKGTTSSSYPQRRQKALQLLEAHSGQNSAESEFDLVVIGGGGLGAYCALDGITRGFKKVLLVEANDFGSGWSGKSSAIVNGSGRSIQRFMRLRSHQHLLQARVDEQDVRHWYNVAAPFLQPMPLYVASSFGTDVLEQGFIAIVSNLVSRYYFVPPATRVTTWVAKNDEENSNGDGGVEGANFQVQQLHAREQHAPLWLSIKKLQDLFHAKPNLSGAFRHTQHLIDDMALTMQLIRTAEAHGAVVLNHCSVVEMEFQPGVPRIQGVIIKDHLAKDSRRIRVGAKAVINATGVWCDEVKQLSPQDGAVTESYREAGYALTPADTIRTTWEPLAAAVSWLMPGNAHEGRSITITPWRNNTYHVGSYDQPTTAPPTLLAPPVAPKSFEKDIGGLSFAARSVGIQDLHKNICGAHSLRFPWLKRENLFEGTPQAIRFEHAVDDRNTGLVTAVGGNWRNMRSFTESLVDAASLQIYEVENQGPRDRSRGLTSSELRRESEDPASHYKRQLAENPSVPGFAVTQQGRKKSAEEKKKENEWMKRYPCRTKRIGILPPQGDEDGFSYFSSLIHTPSKAADAVNAQALSGLPPPGAITPSKDNTNSADSQAEKKKKSSLLNFFGLFGSSKKQTSSGTSGVPTNPSEVPPPSSVPPAVERLLSPEAIRAYIHHQYAATLEDVLCRRNFLVDTNPWVVYSNRLHEKVAEEMQKELGWSAAWTAAQVEQMDSLLKTKLSTIEDSKSAEMPKKLYQLMPRVSELKKSTEA